MVIHHPAPGAPYRRRGSLVGAVPWIAGAAVAGVAAFGIYQAVNSNGFGLYKPGFHSADYLEPRVLQVADASMVRQLSYPDAVNFEDGYLRLDSYTLQERDECRLGAQRSGDEIPFGNSASGLASSCKDRDVIVFVYYQDHETLKTVAQTLDDYTQYQIVRDEGNLETYPRETVCKSTSDYRITRSPQDLDGKPVLCVDQRNVRFFDGENKDVNQDAQFPPYKKLDVDTVPIDQRPPFKPR